MILRRLLTLALLTFAACPSWADLFVSSQNTNTIFRFDEATGAFIEKLIGPSAGLNSPVGMRIGPDGKLYIANQGNGVINKYDFGSGTLSVFASTTIAPTDIQFLANGNMIVSDFFGTTIQQYDITNGNSLGTFATDAGLVQPTNMLIAGNNLYVSSLGAGSVLRFNATTGAFIDTYVAAGSGGLAFPAGIQFGPDNNFYVSSLLTHQVIRYDASDAAPIDPLAPTPFVAAPTDSFPSDLLFVGNDLLIATTGGFGVLKYSGGSLSPFASHPDLLIAGQMLLYSPIPEASSLVLAGLGTTMAVGLSFLRRRA
jgi:sugar lactone lactonase YvrE